MDRFPTTFSHPFKWAGYGAYVAKRRIRAAGILLALAMLLAGACFAEPADDATAIVAENPFMQIAIDEAIEGITQGHGGPFGAVIVRDGEVVGSGHNRVLANNDPTCHGEVSAIRDACANLETYDLTGCELYTTGEPCPMCLFACLWANVDKVYYGCTIEDNAMIGFRDEAFDNLMGDRDELGDYLVCMDREACLELFAAYAGMERVIY